MEPHRRAKYSKSLDPDEIEEVLMDEELEERDKVMEPRVQYSSSSENKVIPRKPKLCFGLQELGIHQMSWILLDLQMVSTNQLPLI